MKEISFEEHLSAIEDHLKQVSEGLQPPVEGVLPRLQKLVNTLKREELSQRRLQKVMHLASNGVTTGTTLAYFRYNRQTSYPVTVVTIDPTDDQIKVTVGDGSNHWVDPLKLEVPQDVRPTRNN